jgi:tetratricopeptide (TPR) repeat protein
VFVSAASSEFRPLRERLAAMLLRSGINVEHQEIFPQTSTDTVRKLGDLVRACPLLVHVVGHDGGSVANATAVADLLDGIPAHELLSHVPDLRARLGDFSGVSYTQWEAWLALHHRVPMLVYAVADAREPGTQALKDTFGQRGHLERLSVARRHPEYCTDEADFVGKILADVHRHFGVSPPAIKPQNLPYPSLGTLFKGRDDFLAQLRARFARGATTVIRARQAVHGMGGVGKTRAAVEYAWAHAHDYVALLFVTADSRDALDSNLAALCGPLVLDLPEQGSRETAVQVAAVRRWLNQHPGWFLILDNVDTPEAQDAVAELLGALGEGHVVVTSRLADWPAGVAALDLDVLSEESGVAFLLERTAGRRTARDDDPRTAAQIVAVLDGLALALEQAAAYIRRRRCALVDYLADWNTKRGAVLGWHDSQKSHYPRSLAVTYDTSVAQLSEDARTLLNILSWMAPDPIPVWAVEKVPVVPDPRSLLVEIADLHLARIAADGTTCTIHRLLQDITRQQQPEAHPAALVAALGWVNAEYPFDSNDVRFWPVALPLTAHAVAVVHRADERHITEPTARLFGQVALFHFAQANHHAAEPLMRRALAIAEASYGETHPTVATYLNNLALLLQATNRLAEAEPLMRRALAIHEASYGEAHPTVATGLNNLAQLLKAIHRLTEAEPLMRRALAINEASYGETHPTVATRLNNLAQLLKATNRLTEAEPLMRRALAIGEATYGDAHPTVATRLNNLALLLKATNRMAEAEPLMRRALAIDEATNGEAHPTVATHLINLAQILQATHRLTEAEPLMRRALAIDEATYGEAHPTVATHLINLAQILQATHCLTEAEPLMRRALAIDEATYGEAHPEVATDLNNLALLLRTTNRLTEAEPLMRRALAIDEASYGEAHPTVATRLGNLAMLLNATNRMAEAEPLMRRALAIDEASYGETHPTVATSLNNLAQLLQDTNRLGEAEPLMRRALAIDEASHGEAHPAVATRLNNLGQLLQATNRLTEAEPLMRRALAIDEATYGEAHPTVATRVNNLAQLLLDTNRLAEAEPLMHRALAINEAGYGEAHPTVATGLNNLALLLKATNRLAEAEPLMRRNVEIVLAFTRDTGHQHPHLTTAIENYVGLLMAMGETTAVAGEKVRALSASYGVEPGGFSGVGEG